MCMEAVFWSEVNKTPFFQSWILQFHILNTLAKTTHNYDINRNNKFGKKISVKFIFLVYFVFSQQKNVSVGKWNESL